MDLVTSDFAYVHIDTWRIIYITFLVIGFTFLRTKGSCTFSSLFSHLAQGISRVHLPPSATLECVVNDVLNRRMLRQHEGYAYRLEEWVDPDKKPTGEEAEFARKPLDLSMTIAEYTRNYASTHFALIREHSKSFYRIQDLGCLTISKARKWSIHTYMLHMYTYVHASLCIYALECEIVGLCSHRLKRNWPILIIVNNYRFGVNGFI